MKNKWISLAIVALMTFSSCATTVQARETDDLPHEGTYFYYDGETSVEALTIMNSAYKSAYELLSYMDILNNETLVAEETATRGLAAHIFGGMKARNVGVATIAPFSDVPLSHEYANGIDTAKQVGVAKNDENGKFRPNADILISDAVEMALATLGYDEAPEGYLRTSAMNRLRQDLLNGISSQNNTLTNGELMFLALNTLEAPMFSPDVFTLKDGVFYPSNIAKESNTILNEYDIDFLRGVVTAVGGFSMFISRSIEQNAVQINRKNYKTSLPLSDELFGKTVCAYIADDFIITAWEDLKYNNVISAKANEFNFVSDTEVEYFDKNGRKESIEIAANALAIYNMESGVTVEQAFAKGLIASANTISLIDNDDDQRIDVVLLYNYDYRIVESLSSSGMIYFKYDKEQIDYKDALSMQLNGKEANITELSVGDVAMVLTTTRYGGKKHRIIFSRDTTGGILEGISEEGDSLIFSIAGTDYEATDFYKKYFTGTDIAPEEVRPAIGDESAFYLAADGFIAASAVSNNEGWNFAYLMGADYRVSGLNDATQIKLFDVSKLAVRTYAIEDDIELFTWASSDSNYTVKSKATPKMVADALIDGSGYKTEMVAYKLDSEGVVSSIATEYVGKTGTPFFVSSYPLVKNYMTGVPGSSNWLYMHVLGTLYNTRQASAIKVPPQGVSNSERMNEVFYNKWDYAIDTHLSTDNSKGDSMAVYNADAASNAGILVYRPEKGAGTIGGTIVDGYATTILVSKKVLALDNEGNEVTRVYYQGDSRIESIDFSNEVEFSALKQAGNSDYYGKPASPNDIGAGDIIQYETDNYGKIRFVRVLFSNDDRGTYRCQYGTGNVLTSTKKEFDSTIVVTWGRVTDKSGTTLVQNLSSTGDNAPEHDYPMFFNGSRNSVHSGGTKYYLWDSRTEKASLITFDEIQKGDEVVVISDYNVSYRAYVYR